MKMFLINSLLSLLLFILLSPAANAVVCVSDKSDPDGDGFGFENGQSCSVVLACKSRQSDGDGDGWGWENQRSCVVTSASQEQPELLCLDTDGDGWGWNGQSSCRNTVVPPIVLPVRCVDTDPLGDGWGWDGQKSCRVSSTPSLDYSLSDITDVVLVTGQSNTLGSNTKVEAGLDDPDKKVFAWTEDGWAVADLHQVWDLGWHPRTTPDGKNPHNNFALHFGKQVAGNSDRVVAFVVLSAPGRPISHWNADQPFFRKIRFQVVAALAALPGHSQIDAILWHQGEDDWYGGSQYRQKLHALIDNFKQEHWFKSQGLFICGETYRAPVNFDLDMLNTDGDINTACVSSAGLGVQADQVHFDASGLRMLGRRYGQKYMSILDGDVSSQ